MQIRTLSESVINKIAAGEVIERPANVIKELLENSVDANAKDIRIDVRGSGLEKIKITDDGEGMNREDLEQCIKRHSTSKVSSEEDLLEIKTLGFRGEALASIAEVSHLVIKTKREEEEVGNMIEVEGGIFLGKQKVACPNGTVVEIQNIFYNVPARKKFLKSMTVEFAHIVDIVTRYALVKKGISIRLTHDSKEIINSQKTDNLLNNIIYIYGTEVAKNLLEVDYSDENITLKGYISKPNLTRANKNEQSIFVNERYVSSNVVTDAIYSAYKTLLFTNRHPLLVLNLDLKNSEIDVNVHPNKLEVRFRNEQEVGESVFEAIKQTLKREILVPNTAPEVNSRSEPSKSYALQKDMQKQLFDEPFKSSQFVYPKSAQKTEIQESQNDENAFYEGAKDDFFEEFFVLGQINRTFIIAEIDQGMLIIDQHAAEERINYERFLEELKSGAVKKQTLLQPKIVELSPVQKQLVREHKNRLFRLGFAVEEFGDNAFRINTVPEIFDRLKEDFFFDILGHLEEINTKVVEDEIEERIIRFACRSSIKAGKEMSLSEMNNLLKRLGQTSNPYSCPHGRPTIIKMPIGDLEKKFKRTGG